MNHNFERLLTDIAVKYRSYDRRWKWDADPEKLERYSQELVREFIKIAWRNGASSEVIMAVQRHFHVMR